MNLRTLLVEYICRNGWLIEPTTETIKEIRNLHNEIKRRLILQSTSTTQGSKTLLDLAVGRGGDLHKWKLANINTVTAVDNDYRALFGDNGALQRTTKKKGGPKVHLLHHDITSTDFMNALTNFEMQTFKTTKLYDVVSCQFALNHLVTDNKSINNFIKLTTSKMKQNANLIMTVTNGDKIKRVNYADNSLIQISCTLDNYNFNLKSDTGSTYFDIVGDNQENYVSPDALVNIMNSNGLKVIDVKPFSKWYDECDIYLSAPQLCVSCLYFSVTAIKL